MSAQKRQHVQKRSLKFAPELRARQGETFIEFTERYSAWAKQNTLPFAASDARRLAERFRKDFSPAECRDLLKVFTKEMNAPRAK